MRFLIAFGLVAHAVAHLVGVVAAWRVATLDEMPYRTTLLAGRLDVGDGGMRVAGGLWLMAAIGFAVAAAAIVAGLPWALRLTATMAAASLILCVGGWPEARIGLFVNLAILIALAARP
jgi:hypothetical protein